MIIPAQRRDPLHRCLRLRRPSVSLSSRCASHPRRPSHHQSHCRRRHPLPLPKRVSRRTSTTAHRPCRPRRSLHRSRHPQRRSSTPLALPVFAVVVVNDPFELKMRSSGLVRPRRWR
ncbi:hypothetical protein FA13DRAFT_305798 [Coprinellus micaceus]|uniref:Uncharacterized protein n=1 Tax=Coprinellus micaceus TaxID=71717 RepID=A0A4Y7SDI3_COPMI|nr:hypothetical protein FA13DRAFT_305798 [Coprinellus micaceus]